MNFLTGAFDNIEKSRMVLATPKPTLTAPALATLRTELLE
jgi:hypothetical protein